MSGGGSKLTAHHKWRRGCSKWRRGWFVTLRLSRFPSLDEVQDPDPDSYKKVKKGSRIRITGWGVGAGGGAKYGRQRGRVP
jgi:hypothetical protein